MFHRAVRPAAVAGLALLPVLGFAPGGRSRSVRRRAVDGFRSDCASPGQWACEAFFHGSVEVLSPSTRRGAC